ncbi:MAG: type II toxin-antitoxin system Phd/YefM family antitoxin [bacterium]
MQNVLPSEDICSINQLGNQTAKLLKNVQKKHRPVFLISKGKAAGVLMDIDEYERLIELTEFRKALRASLAQADRGEVISHEQAIKESKRWLRKTAR